MKILHYLLLFIVVIHSFSCNPRHTITKITSFTLLSDGNILFDTFFNIPKNIYAPVRTDRIKSIIFDSIEVYINDKPSIDYEVVRDIINNESSRYINLKRTIFSDENTQIHIRTKSRIFSAYQISMIKNLSEFELYFLENTVIANPESNIEYFVKYSSNNSFFRPSLSTTRGEFTFLNYDSVFTYFRKYTSLVDKSIGIRALRINYMNPSSDSLYKFISEEKWLTIENDGIAKERHTIGFPAKNLTKILFSYPISKNIDLLDLEVKINTEGTEILASKIDSAKMKEIMSQKDSTSYPVYYYGSNLIGTINNDAIQLFLPLPNKTFTISLNFSYNTKHLISDDGFNYKLKYYHWFSDDIRDDKLIIQIPNDYSINEYNFKDKIIDHSKNFVMIKNANTASNIYNPIEINYTRDGTIILNFLRYINIAIFIIFIIVIFNYHFLKKNNWSRIINLESILLIFPTPIISISMKINFLSAFIYSYSYLMIIPILYQKIYSTKIKKMIRAIIGFRDHY